MFCFVVLYTRINLLEQVRLYVNPLLAEAKQKLHPLLCCHYLPAPSVA